ncbi:MAG: putative quinol monooxygenase [Pseudomonadota bacterium]
MFAVVVTFEIAASQMETFLKLVTENARASLAHEPGCHVFDVCTDPQRSGEVFLYELYDDEAAFAAHLKSPHFASFDSVIGEMVVAKDVRTYGTVAR